MNPLLFISASVPPPGGGTPLQEANGDFLLNGVAFSIELLGWVSKFSDFGGNRYSRWEDSRLKKFTIRMLLFIKFNSKLALTYPGFQRIFFSYR